jgi:DNA-binding GntR family transcriptional regulator
MTLSEGKMGLRIPENLTQQAFSHIRDEIIRGKLDDRQHLTENYFAERFGISKSPVREALNRLESEGLITIVPRRGAFVVKLSVQDIEEIFDLREALEALVVKGAVLDENLLARMRAAVMSAKRYWEENDKTKYIRADAAFHTTLAEANSNSRLKKILENMRNQILIVRARTFELSSRTSVKQHLDILGALEEGKRDIAANLMVEHIRTVRARLVNHLRERENASGVQEDVPA